MAADISVHKGVAHPWTCDVMGHMTTRFYVAMFDDASYHFLNMAFPGVNEDSRLGWADVRHVIEYQREVAAGDLLEVFATLTKIGGKSVSVRYRMQNVTRGEVAATLEAITVLFDLEARQGVQIPDPVRQSAVALLVDGND